MSVNTFNITINQRRSGWSRRDRTLIGALGEGIGGKAISVHGGELIERTRDHRRERTNTLGRFVLVTLRLCFPIALGGWERRIQCGIRGRVVQGTGRSLYTVIKDARNQYNGRSIRTGIGTRHGTRHEIGGEIFVLLTLKHEIGFTLTAQFHSDICWLIIYTDVYDFVSAGESLARKDINGWIANDEWWSW